MKTHTLAVYEHAVALEPGIIIADTKLEFGMWNDEVILIDKALTPDSSRFWPIDGYRPGGAQPSFDKQPVRDWMAANWKDGDPPGHPARRRRRDNRTLHDGIQDPYRRGATCVKRRPDMKGRASDSPH